MHRFKQGGELADYWVLCKPRVVLLMLMTSWVGMFWGAPLGSPDAYTLCLSSLGISLAAAAAAVLNHVIDRRLDQQMARTAHRPLAAGRLSPPQALIFSGLLAGLSFVCLRLGATNLALWLCFLTLAGYGLIYTCYLKHATPQNIVIGGLAGAMPPVLGAIAVSNPLQEQSLVLTLIIFVWTPPHFWALAIYREADYAAAKIPMLPNTHGIPFTKWSILLYTILLFPVTCLPFVLGIASALYLVSAFILNSIFLYHAVRLYCTKGQAASRAMQTFRYSLLYLLGIFTALLGDYYGFVARY